jgi:hypothetical protein
MHVSNLSRFQAELMTICSICHRLEHAENTHAPHSLIDHISSVNIGWLIASRYPHTASIRRCSLPRICTAFHPIARHTEGNSRLGCVLRPEVEVSVCRCLKRGSRIALINGNGIPILFQDQAQGFGRTVWELVLCSSPWRGRALILELPVPCTRNNSIHQRDIVTRGKMHLRPNHIRRLRIRDYKLGIRCAEGCVEEGLVVVDYHRLAEEAFCDIYCFVVFLVCGFGKCCCRDTALNRGE